MQVLYHFIWACGVFSLLFLGWKDAVDYNGFGQVREDWQLCCIGKENLMSAAVGFSLDSSFRAEQSGFSLTFPGMHMKVNFLFERLGRWIKSYFLYHFDLNAFSLRNISGKCILFWRLGQMIADLSFSAN